MIWLAAAVPLVLICVLLYLWHRRRTRARMISFVALLREPMNFDPAVLARVAGKCWEADLGDGASEGPDGFVVCTGPFNTIVHKGSCFLLNSIPRPYVDDPDRVAASISDMRIRSLFLEHKAWFSCDAMGIDGRTPQAVVQDSYGRLGKLFADLLDDNCLLIFLPDTSSAFPINDDTETALRSPDPVKALQDTLTLPVVEVSADDPLVMKAVETARQEWPKFVAAFEARSGENFSVKAPVTHSGNTEFIWISVTSIEGDLVYGELGNDPARLGPLKLGSKVSVPIESLHDWCYIDPKGDLAGGFSIEAVRKASRRSQK